MPSLANVYRLGIKELWSLMRDSVMLILIGYTFTFAIYVSATATPDTLHNAPIAIVDEDSSPLSIRIASAFHPPQFRYPDLIAIPDIDKVLDAGIYTFVLNIPPNFQRDVLAGHASDIQLNVDATRMTQAFMGNSYIQQIVNGEVVDFLSGYRQQGHAPVELALRMRFNPSLDGTWFGSLTELINSITMLSIILTGAALIREREHGTVEHLLVMPVTPAEIMLSKIWAMGAVVLGAASLSLLIVVQKGLSVPIEGSIPLFLLGTGLHLFATTSMGIFMATLARTMPQFGLLLMLTLLPLEMLSGGTTPRESMPQLVQDVMLLAPTTHFVALGQAILFRGAGFDVVWPQFLALALIGSALFMLSLFRFRGALSQMA